MQYCNRLVILCTVLFFSVQVLGQNSAAEDITGLWKGTMYNDTTRQYLKYEIAISENRGKLSGYSHTYFILNDKEYHGVKRVRVKRKDGKIIVEDLELIANNYPVPPAKGVRQLDVLDLEIKDGVMILSGPFSTNRTREYSSLTGYINVQRKNNFHQSALIPHLEELKLADDLSFVKEEKLNAVKTETATEPPVAKSVTVEKEKKAKESRAKEKVIKESEKKMEKELVKKEPEKKSTPETKQAAADIDNRIIETIQSVYYKTDSLVLTLYDNGEVDGDTVSVVMNGNVIMPNVGLSTNAVKKTIYTHGIAGDSIQLVMYAESLGSLPPNTGLLIVYDGNDRYEIRFSGDLRKNAAIVFRKK